MRLPAWQDPLADCVSVSGWLIGGTGRGAVVEGSPGVQAKGKTWLPLPRADPESQCRASKSPDVPWGGERSSP